MESGGNPRFLVSGTAHAELRAQPRRRFMNNFQSFAGSLIWAAIAGVLMLATFEPVESGSAQTHVQLAAKAPIAAHAPL